MMLHVPTAAVWATAAKRTSLKLPINGGVAIPAYDSLPPLLGVRRNPNDERNLRERHRRTHSRSPPIAARDSSAGTKSEIPSKTFGRFARTAMPSFIIATEPSPSSRMLVKEARRAAR